MQALLTSHLRPLFIAVSIVAAAAVFTWRLRETNRPINARRILMPPLGMSTGLFMFVFPPTRIPLSWAAAALVSGALFFTYPLVKTSRLTRRADAILLQRSPAFLWILVGLVTVRFAVRSWVEHLVSPMQTGSIFFLVALGMIVPWRILMYRDYQRLAREGGPAATSSSP